MRKVLFITILILCGIQIFGSNCDYTPGKSNVVMCSESGVIIGGTLKGCGGCVQWTPTEGLTSPNSVQTKATPSKTTQYTLEIYDSEFNLVATDHVTVVVDKTKMITGIVASPECCYKRGEALNAQNLHITTTPPGLEENVEIDPSSASDNFHMDPVISMEIDLKNTCGDNTLIVTKTISVVDEDMELSEGFKLVDIDDLLDKMEKTIEKANKVLEKVNKIKFKCEGKTELTNGLKISYGEKCCKGNSGCSVKHNMKISGTAGVAGGVECSADLPWLNVPYISSFYISGELSASLTTSVNWDYNCGNSELCLEAKPSVALGFKVGYKMLDGYLIDVNIGPVFGVEIKDAFKWCPMGDVPPSNPQLCINLTVEGSYTFLSGVYSDSFTYKVIEDKCWYLD